MDPRLWPEGSYELGSVHPSSCPEVFLRLAHYIFLKRRMLLETLVVFCVTEPNFLKKNFFDQKMWKMGQKYGFLNLFENLVINFFWIWSEKESYHFFRIYIICFLAQIPYLGKIWFPRYRSKSSGPIRLQDFYIPYISITK